jgi:hypothetical protein
MKEGSTNGCSGTGPKLHQVGAKISSKTTDMEQDMRRNSRRVVAAHLKELTKLSRLTLRV